MKEFDIDEESYIGEIIENSIKHVKNDIYLSNNQKNILSRYDINYNNFNNLSSLIFEIEEILNSGYGDDDLEHLSDDLQQIQYYNNTNK